MCQCRLSGNKSESIVLCAPMKEGGLCGVSVPDLHKDPNYVEQIESIKGH